MSYRLRPFLNSDPPHLAAIWRSQGEQRGILQPATAPLLEYGVCSKMHFDRHGLIVAERDGMPRGFVHAGFGPNEDGSAIDASLGVTLMLMVHAEEGECAPRLADQLLAASETYLRSRGAGVLYAGGVHPLNSFYLGLYGGSELPGVLQGETLWREACLRANYQPIERIVILQCDLIRFRQPVSRDQRIVKRTTQFVEQVDPPARTWWEACVWGGLQRDRFELLDNQTRRTMAKASFWDIQPLSASWGMSAAGLYQLEVDPEARRKGYASHLLGEAIRILQRRGVTTIEAQTMATNEPALAFYEKMGFTEIDHGHVFRKKGDS